VWNNDVANPTLPTPENFAWTPCENGWVPVMAKLPQHQKPSSILTSANVPRRNVPQTAVSVEKLILTALISVVVQTVGNHVKTCMKVIMMMMMMMMMMQHS